MTAMEGIGPDPGMQKTGPRAGLENGQKKISGGSAQPPPDVTVDRADATAP